MLRGVRGGQAGSGMGYALEQAEGRARKFSFCWCLWGEVFAVGWDTRSSSFGKMIV